jgi:hypothetical protein
VVAPDQRLGKEEEVSGYERLRCRALGAAGKSGEGHGWSLLVARGMLAWLGALASYGAVAFSPERGRESGRDGEVPALGADIIRVLTNMALGSRS